MNDSANPTADTALVADPAEQIAILTSERDQLSQEKADLRDQLLRRQAEFENFRRRSERERMDYAEYAGMEVIRPLIPVLDDLERAVNAAKASDKESSELVKGVELIYTRLLDTLKKMGLEPIDSVGKPFDPHVHEAMSRVESPDAEDNTVIEEFQRGYNFKNRLLRPAMVKVAVRP